ncbi:MAG TPA: hypothetical protein VGM34_04160, partial [Chlamydiales bacterium]
MELRKLFALLFLFLFCAAVGKSWHLARGGFRFDRCVSDPAFIFLGQEPSLEQSQALSQPFRYLAAGRQSYVFESADGKYVLKLPRTDIYRAAPWREAGDRQFRKASVSKSIELSLGLLHAETKLQAIAWPHPVTLIDRLGRQRSWSRSVWLLQPKTLTLSQQIERALRAGDSASARHAVQSFAALLSRIQKKGVVCKDLSFTSNIGYDGKEAFFIDTGAFRPKEAWPHPMTSHIRLWLQAADSQL